MFQDHLVGIGQEDQMAGFALGVPLPRPVTRGLMASVTSPERGRPDRRALISPGTTTRVQDTLAVTLVVRELDMFGGRAFMVNEKMLVSVGRDGELLVRVDPERSEELLAVAGAGRP